MSSYQIQQPDLESLIQVVNGTPGKAEAPCMTLLAEDLETTEGSVCGGRLGLYSTDSFSKRATVETHLNLVVCVRGGGDCRYSRAPKSFKYPSQDLIHGWCQEIITYFIYALRQWRPHQD